MTLNHRIRVSLYPIKLPLERVNELHPEIPQCLSWWNRTSLKNPSASGPPSEHRPKLLMSSHLGSLLPPLRGRGVSKPNALKTMVAAL